MDDAEEVRWQTMKRSVNAKQAALVAAREDAESEAAGAEAAAAAAVATEQAQQAADADARAAEALAKREEV